MTQEEPREEPREPGEGPVPDGTVSATPGAAERVPAETASAEATEATEATQVQQSDDERSADETSSDQKPADTEPVPEPSTESTAETPADDEKHGRHRSTQAGWFTRSHVLVAVLCAALGFAIVVQVRQTHADEYSLLRQNDLVALLDEITQRNDQLEAEQAQLILDRNDLEAGVGASEVAERNATIQSILAGTVPVTGPGVEITISEGDTMIPVSAWVNLVEELRNSGAEAIEIGGVRFGAASWFAEEDGHVLVDGVPLTSPVYVRAIGDSQALEGGVQFRGGALPTLRLYGAVTSVDSVREVVIASVRSLHAPEIAEPAPEESKAAG